MPGADDPLIGVATTPTSPYSSLAAGACGSVLDFAVTAAMVERGIFVSHRR